MLDSLDQLPAIRDGKLNITHSLGNKGENTLADVRYLLFSPHDHHDENGTDPMGTTHIPDEIMAKLDLDKGLLEAYLESERDKGIDPLSRAILDKVPGGLLVNSQTNRGVVNGNKNTDANPLPGIWTPETFAEVEAPLLAIHASQLDAYRKIVAALGKEVPVLHMHSMDNSGPKKGLRPALSRENLAAYVEAQGWSLDRRNPRKHDFITGKENGPRLANMELYEGLGTLFDQNGMKWAYNEPYDTEEGYPDYDDMVARPGRVIAPDLLKSSLCKAVGSTFDSRTAEVDPVKVAFMADLFAQALRSRGI